MTDRPCRDGYIKDVSGNCAEVEQSETGDDEVEIDTDVDPDTEALYHPVGFDEPTVHSVLAKNNDENCTECHGEQLDGGTSQVSCDSCHPEGWRTNCVFCHGGEDNVSGAPPRDLSGAVVTADLVFRAHTPHVEGRIHDGFGCEQCHDPPDSVTSPGHLFDSTPGRAEVVFGQGLASAGHYEGAGTCTNIYCHSNAVGGNGTYAHTNSPPDCGACHPGPDSSVDEMMQMTSQHAYHVDVAGLGCERCHDAIVNGQHEIVGLDLHVNGQVDVTISELIYDGFTCNGSCHSGSGEAHLHTDYTWGPPPGGP